MVEPITACDLVIPNKSWVQRAAKFVPGLSKIAQLEFDNLNAIEQWARRFRRECVSSGGVGWIFGSERYDTTGGALFEMDITIPVACQVFRTGGGRWQMDSTGGQPILTLVPTLDPSNTYMPSGGPVTTGVEEYESAHVSGVESLPAGTHTLGLSFSTGGPSLSSGSFYQTAICMPGGSGQTLDDSSWASG